MDLQEIISNAVKADRAKEMLTSDQLTLGELVLLLKGIKNKDLPVIFDDEHKPTGFCSWRGSYDEIAICYEDSCKAYDQPKPDCKMSYGSHAYDCPCGCPSVSTELKDPKVSDMINVIEKIIGRYMVGYKGGDFTMGKTTPVWIANYGESMGWTGESQGVTGVTEKNNAVYIDWQVMSY